MATLHCAPDDAEIPFDPDRNVLEHMLGAGVRAAHACGGNARCSTCRVRVLEGLAACRPRTEAERKIAERLDFPDEIRLACQTRLSGPVRLRRLVLDDEDLALASQIAGTGERRCVGKEEFVAVLFSDIEGFTSLSEALPAYDIVHILNRFYAAAGETIAASGGCIANYMGDGLMALFGLDAGRDEAPLNAVKAGLGLLAAADRVAKYLQDAYGRGFAIRVGVHCGPAVVGHVGAPGGRRETAIGDTINVASRIEAANKRVETRLLVSEDVRRRVAAHVEVGRGCDVELRGKSGTLAVHEITGLRA